MDKLIVLTGVNGVGKTSILEAISFLYPGTGIRYAKFGSIVNNITNNDWKLYAVVNKNDISHDIFMHCKSRRKIYINNKLIKKQQDLSLITNIVWFSPQVYYKFLNFRNSRRQVLDRMVYLFDSSHADIVWSYSYLISERNQILSNYSDSAWLVAVEKRIAKYGVKIFNNRKMIIDKINSVMLSNDIVKPLLKIFGKLEENVCNMKEEESIEWFEHILCKNRAIDCRHNSCHVGPHRSNFYIVNEENKLGIDCCSMGEQIMLFMFLIIAQIQTKLQYWKDVPVVLLDDICLYLDKKRQSFLLEKIRELNCQTFITVNDLNNLCSVENLFNIKL